MDEVSIRPRQRSREPGRHDRMTGLEEDHFWFDGRRRLVRELIRRNLATPGHRVLDVGSGSGWALDVLERLGHRPLGIDLDPSSSGLRRIVRSETERLPLSDSSVDAVLALDVLEHVDDRRALSEIYRVLRPGGLLLVTVPAFPGLWSDRDVVAGHRRRYTRPSLRQVLARAGFSVRELRGYQLFLLPLAAASRMFGRAREDARREARLSPFLNRTLSAVTSVELALGRIVRWPTGLSLVAVCRRGG